MEEVETTRTNQSAAQAPFGVLITSLFCFFFFVIYTDVDKDNSTSTMIQ